MGEFPIGIGLFVLVLVAGIAFLGVVLALGVGTLIVMTFRRPRAHRAVSVTTLPNSGTTPPPSRPIRNRRNNVLASLWRFTRSLWWIPLLLFIFIFSFLSPSFAQAMRYIVVLLLQIAFALLYAIMQFVAIFWFMSRSKVEEIRPEDAKAVTFNDYWGQPTLLRLVKQWITLLADREQFVGMGGKYINGILLYGPPGTGKTMLAKAMAGEAGVPFISIEGSGFRAMFWGVDVLKMIWFCNKAKKLAREYGACIAYIDEIDAVGASRGGVMGGAMGMMGGGSGSLTRLLYEMDGIGEQTRWERWLGRMYKFVGLTAPQRTWHVLYMGSTNRPDVLDPALLRPGRFDQKIVVDVPDKAGRREIIKGYLSKLKCDSTVNLEAIVEDTPNATPAQIASALTKDAVRIALFKGRHAIAQRDIDLALQEQRMGIEQPIEEWDEAQRRQVAYHEAGHAVVQHYLMPEQRIVRASIVRRGGALGYILPVDRVEVYSAPLRRYAAQIMVAMGGHVATKIHMGEYWTGASGDFSMIRRHIWVLYSLGYFGPPTRGTEGGVPASADPLVERFWKVLEDQTEQLLLRHTAEVEAITRALLDKGELSHDEVMALLGDNGWRAEPLLLPTAPQIAPPERLVLGAVIEALQPNSTLPAPPPPQNEPVPAPIAPPPARRMLTPPQPDKFNRR